MAQSKSGKKLMNMVYGLGAAVVILGALFKIMHWPFGNEMLIIGLITEAKIDANLMSSLGDSIKNFEGAAKNMSPTVDAISSQKKYSEELTLAAAQMETLNNLYKVQVESAAKQSEANTAAAENAVALKAQMESLTQNLSSLNGVYGNMLNAMGNNRA